MSSVKATVQRGGRSLQRSLHSHGCRHRTRASWPCPLQSGDGDLVLEFLSQLGALEVINLVFSRIGAEGVGWIK